MKKISKISLWFFIIFSVFYSVTWFYQASRINSLIESGKFVLTETLNFPAVSFFYSNAHVSDFPFSFSVELDKPHFILNHNHQNITFRPIGPLTIKGSLFSNTLVVTLPEKISIGNVKEFAAQNSLQFSSAPTITLELTSSSRWPLWIATSFSQPTIALADLNYESEGFKFISAVGVPLLSGQHHQLHLLYKDHIQGALATHLIAQADDLILDALLNESGDNSHLFSAPASFAADIMLVTPYVEGKAQDATNIRINEITYESKNFNLQAFADFSASENDFYPFGKMQIALRNYANFVDYHTSLTNYLLDRSELITAGINEGQRESIKQVLKEISSQSYNDEKDITIQVSRPKQGQLLIGKYPMDSVLTLVEEHLSTRN
jgi:hypothetical protein